MIQLTIKKLIDYGISKGLIVEYDRKYVMNQLFDLFQIEEVDEELMNPSIPWNGKDTKAEKSAIDTELRIQESGSELQAILRELCDYAYESGIIAENSVTYRDLFDTKIMGYLTARPSEVISKFYSLYDTNKKEATDYFYQFCKDTDYIREYRIVKDKKWITKTEYGDLDITINLSKPEKDPKAIAAAKLSKASSYPKCLLCVENVGFAGTLSHPARQNLRVMPINIRGEEWGFQYSPYVYYNEHCIVLNASHTPMTIEKETFYKLFDFVKIFPHYFVGSNADLPIVGGSILAHEHFQGGNYTFAMAKAEIETELTFAGYEDVQGGIVKWPMSVIRLRGTDSNRLCELADKILSRWRSYTDDEAFIYAYTDEAGNFIKENKDGKAELHNTITPIARKSGDFYELDLVLRNNVTTKEHPLGIYHPHTELHHIKKENIGLIEVMGLAVLPARLLVEMQTVKEYLLSGKSLMEDEATKSHAVWVESFKRNYPKIDESNIDSIFEVEIGKVFANVLEHAGVYKRTKDGKEAFLRFIQAINN